MERIYINGGIPLRGNVKIQGSKNAALPILAATLLVQGKCEIDNCPKISDVYQMITLLKSLGCKVNWENDGVVVDANHISVSHLPKEASVSMRSSITLLGVILSKFKEAIMDYPGGCVIGQRPIDLHIQALKEMNVAFVENSNKIIATTSGLIGAEVDLPQISVGATENIILAAVLAEGSTTIYNPAKEPEIVALCDFLNLCGAKICGQGSDKIKIVGVTKLTGVKYTIPSDRIVAGTYIYACIATKGEVLLNKADGKELKSVLEQIDKMGVKYQIAQEGIYIKSSDEITMPIEVRTKEYPGFPTDLQSQLMSVMCSLKGTGKIYESIFENRFHIVEPLVKMGADISVLDCHRVQIKGGNSLKGTQVEAKELRGGAALVIAGLSAKGETMITNCHYIDRGYENICRDFRELGARIYCV